MCWMNHVTTFHPHPWMNIHGHISAISWFVHVLSNNETTPMSSTQKWSYQCGAPMWMCLLHAHYAWIQSLTVGLVWHRVSPPTEYRMSVSKATYSSECIGYVQNHEWTHSLTCVILLYAQNINVSHNKNVCNPEGAQENGSLCTLPCTNMKCTHRAWCTTTCMVAWNRLCMHACINAHICMSHDEYDHRGINTILNARWASFTIVCHLAQVVAFNITLC